MKLININKPRYRRHIKVVMAGCAIGLAIGSLAISQTLIALFPDADGSHFHWNVLGVIVSALWVAWLLNRYRRHPLMTEVVYVWELKQAMNKIQRKMPKLQTASHDGNADAMLAIQYSYDASRLLWHLDDNTLLMEELAIKQTELNSLAEKHGLTLCSGDYDDALLQAF